MPPLQGDRGIDISRPRSIPFLTNRTTRVVISTEGLRVRAEGSVERQGERDWPFPIDPSIRFQLHPAGFAVTSRSLGMTSVDGWAINLPSAGGASPKNRRGGIYPAPGICRPLRGLIQNLSFLFPGADAPGYASVAPPALITAPRSTSRGAAADI